MWRIKNQSSNSTSCSDNALIRLLVVVAGGFVFEDFKWCLHFQVGVAFWRVVWREVCICWRKGKIAFEGPHWRLPISNTGGTRSATLRWRGLSGVELILQPASQPAKAGAKKKFHVSAAAASPWAIGSWVAGTPPNPNKNVAGLIALARLTPKAPPRLLLQPTYYLTKWAREGGREGVGRTRPSTIWYLLYRAR